MLGEKVIDTNRGGQSGQGWKRKQTNGLFSYTKSSMLKKKKKKRRKKKRKKKKEKKDFSKASPLMLGEKVIDTNRGGGSLGRAGRRKQTDDLFNYINQAC